MRKITIFFLVLILSVLAETVLGQVSQSWVARYSGSRDDQARKIAVDDSGNVYVTGMTVNSSSNTDYLIIKYDKYGNQLWASKYNGTGNGADTVRGIALYGNGVYVTGQSYNGSNHDYLTIKYNPINGDSIWVKTYDDGRDDEAWGITICGGAVWVTGESRKTLNDDIVTIKYRASDGYQLCEKTYNHTGYNDYGTAICSDGTNVYVTGGSFGIHGFDYITIAYRCSDCDSLWSKTYDGPGIVNSWDFAWAIAARDGGVFVTGESEGIGGNSDYATVKYRSSDGQQLWVARHDGAIHSVDKAYAIAIDNSDNAWVTGMSTINLSMGQQCIFTIEYDGNNGNGLDSSIYCSGMESSSEIGRDITLDRTGNAYVTGRISNPQHNYDYVTVKYAPNCQEEWAMWYNGPGHSKDDAYAVTVDSLDNVYVTGESGGDTTGLDFATIKYTQQPCTTTVFKPNRDGWSFGNYENIMWPQSWWSQFDYTQSPPYPQSWRYYCHSEDYPDWPLFAELFRNYQCYWVPPSVDSLRPIYKQRAVLYWRIVVDMNNWKDDNGNSHPWSGSCFGFSTSSLLYFNKLCNRSVSGDFDHSYNYLYQVPLSDSSRKVVNKYENSIWGAQHLLYFYKGWSSSVKTTANDLMQMLTLDCSNDRTMFMFPEEHVSNKLPGHSFVACSLSQDENNPAKLHTYCYSSCYPGQYKVLDIDRSAGTWQSWWHDWYGSKHLFLMEPLSAYCDTPIIPGMFPHKDEWPISTLDTTKQLYLFNSYQCDIMIRNLSGEFIGYTHSSKGTLQESMAHAAPILIPGPDSLNGRPPVGYIVPKNTYTTQLSNSPDTTVFFSVFNDSSVFYYDRHDFQAGQSDYLKYYEGGKKFLISNPDGVSKNSLVKVINALPDREMKGDIGIHNLSQYDTLQIEIIDQTKFKILNIGSQKKYDINLELAAESPYRVFVRDTITIAHNCSHLISANWNAMDTMQLSIFVDCDLNGTFEDTLFEENQCVRRGDINTTNGDGVVDIGDVVFLINYLFKTGSIPYNMLAADVNDDGSVDVGDIVYLINYLYKNGTPPFCLHN